jgi:hypothetical protein
MAGRLPKPVVRVWGYCITQGFKPRLLNVLINHPSIVSNDINFQ